MDQIRLHFQFPEFDDVCLRNNLPKIKDGTYILNPDGYKSVETLVTALQVNGDDVTYLDSFGVEYIPKDIQATKTSQQIFIPYKKITQ